MYKSKLLQYLSHFSKQDLRSFRDFVHSPFFNKHERTKALLDYLLAAPHWQHASLVKEKVFRHLFPQQKYNEQLLRTVMSYLVQLIYQFYRAQNATTRPLTQQIDLLEAALRNGQKKMFDHLAKQCEKNFRQTKIKDRIYFLEQSRYQRLLDTFDLKYGNRTSGDFLAEALFHFDRYYLGEKLRMTCEMLARKQVTGQQYTVPLIDELVLFLEKEKARFQHIPGVWLYFLIYKMMVEKAETYFFQLKARLKTDARAFQPQEARDFYTHALNYCIGKLNFGETHFRKETFELYQQMLTDELLYIEGVLPQWDYTNIVSLGCDLQEEAWTKKFIVEQKGYLPKAERENTYTYNLAAFYYAQKNYAAAIPLLQQVAFTEVYYNLLTRILMLKIYFETEDWETLRYFLETFRIYLLRSQQLGASRRQSALNLLKYTRSLLRLLETRSVLGKQKFVEKIEKLKQQIEANEKVLNKSWLLEACTR